MGKNICSGCDLTFGSVGSHSKHRVGSYGDAIYDKHKHVIGYEKPTRRCLTVDEMLASGWTTNPRGWWMKPEKLTRTDDNDIEEEETEEIEEVAD